MLDRIKCRINQEKRLKLGKRLAQLAAMAANQYDHIWDCCCDHGFLGAALLARNAAPHIHFVDVVPELMQQLEQKLRRFFPLAGASHNCSQWHVHCKDVAGLAFAKFGGKHLIIIAGVGGNLISEFVKNIATANPSAEIDFLLCPTLHQYALRQQLIALDFRLKSETLIVDKNRYYEIVLVTHSKNGGSHISPVGEKIWQADTPEQKKIAAAYLRKTLAHYRRVGLNDQLDAQPIIHAYSSVNL